MNGTGIQDGRAGYGGRNMLPNRLKFAEPGGKTLMEGYRKDVLSEFETDKPIYNPVSTPSRVALSGSCPFLT